MSNMKYILLTQGKRAIVDDEDYEWLSQFRWYYKKDRWGGYAVRHDLENHNRLIRMHRIINNTPDSLITDHINRDKLDNQRSNLRTVTFSENSLNTNSKSSNTSGYRGICLSSDRKKWQARIMVKGRSIHLGLFMDINEAIRVRNLAVKKYGNAV